MISSSSIYLDRENVDRSLTIPRSVNFELDRDSLEAIIEAIQSDRQITLNAETLTDFRYYVLITSQDKERTLTFLTHYWQNGEKIPVIRSVIALNGKISQQIRRDCLQNSQLLPKLIRVHYWLILQTIAQLPFTTSKSIGWLPQIILLIFNAIAAVVIITYLPASWIVKLLSIAIVLTCSTLSSKSLLRIYLKPWILRQLIGGCFANRTQSRQMGLKLLKAIGHK
jgi:hypothetical protein